MPRGIYKRSEAQIQRAKERMKKIGLGRKGKKKDEPHAQPMEEVKPKPAEVKVTTPISPMPQPVKTPEPEKPIEEVNKDLQEVGEKQKKEELPTEPTRPLTGPEIRKIQEEGGKCPAI